jgi:hypothetical protein
MIAVSLALLAPFDGSRKLHFSRTKSRAFSIQTRGPKYRDHFNDLLQQMQRIHKRPRFLPSVRLFLNYVVEVVCYRLAKLEAPESTNWGKVLPRSWEHFDLRVFRWESFQRLKVDSPKI